MKKRFNLQFQLTVLIGSLSVLSLGRLPAQTFTTLYNFTAAPDSLPALNRDGAWPTSRLLLSGNLLYGTTAYGGPDGFGTVFAVQTDGTGFTNLYSFAYAHTNSSGVYSKSGLVLFSNLLYGTAQTCGPLAYGTVFALSPRGKGCANVHYFQGLPDGAIPWGALLLSSNLFYGTAAYGGTGVDGGTLFAMKSDGSSFRVVHDFPTDWLGNVDGSEPQGDLALSPSGTTLYGAARKYGVGYTTNGAYLPGSGTVFAVNTNGSGFRILHQFTPWTGGYNSLVFNNDGCTPTGGVVLSASGNTLYGTTETGGRIGYGVAYAVNTDGSGFKVLHEFSTSEGIPTGGLVLSPAGNLLYGTAFCDGVGGTLFALNTDGSGFAILHRFPVITVADSDNADGTDPNPLILSGTTLYGTTQAGGSAGSGTIFSLGLGLSATVSATPQRGQLGDTIKVVVNVLNSDSASRANVRLSSPITISGAGVVTPAGFSGPTMTSSLGPLATTSFTYLYTATNYGTVTFSAAATGVGPEGGETSASATSLPVTIAPMGDLMVKSTDPSDTTFSGNGEFQQPPPVNDQDLTQPVSSTGAAAYLLRLQNDEPVARSYRLRATTNTLANWTVKILAGGTDITAGLFGGGWTTPQLAPGGYVDTQVSLAPTPKAGMADNMWIQFTALADSTSTDVLDAVRLHATLVPVPVKVTINQVAGSGYTSDSLQASDINAPLVPSLDPNVLANNLAIIHGGLVADGVTPLVLRLQADAASIAQYPDGKDFVFQASSPSEGNFLAHALIGQRLALLRNGVWQAATDVVLSASSPVAYVQFLPIDSDDLVIVSQPPGVNVDFRVQDKVSGIQAGDIKFALQKPPIALVHGYASPGDWGGDFKTTLAASRPYGAEGSPHNFICTVKYGQNAVPGILSYVEANTIGTPVLENTIASLADCAQKLQQALLDAMQPLHQNWAFTRFDAVGHSQGGVLSRMLCNAAVTPTIAWPFRNANNCYRGRFHRVVTIGSPHNGSRLLHYLLDLNQLYVQREIDNPIGTMAFLLQYAQPKFDPFLDQIRSINTPGGPWQPDPGAPFHLVRTVIDNGASPKLGDFTPSYVALGLSTQLGGLAVLPRGSDGIVDFDSMAANVPSVPLGANVFTVPAGTSISHAAPVLLFLADDFQTSSTLVAKHVIGALDQDSSMNPSEIVFAPFTLPLLLDSNVEAVIDNYAATGQFTTLKAGPALLPHALDGGGGYQYQVSFPSNFPPVGSVTWFVQVYDSAGLTSDGVELTPGGSNDSEVTVTVDDALIGDVVLSGIYLSESNTVVTIPPTLVVSRQPVGATLRGFQLVPANIALPVGTVVSPQVVANYSDGSSSQRFVAPGTLTAFSTQPSVVSVSDPLNWQLAAVGAAHINVTWSGFTASSQITVFDESTNASPVLSLLPTGNGQWVAAWAGFTMGYVLESTRDLRQTNSWLPVATAPVSGGGWTAVTLAATNAPQFFRLRWNPSAIPF